MKTCTACNVDKPETEFYKCARWKDGLQKQCKICHKGLNQRHYASNKSDYIDRAKAQSTEIRELYQFIKEEVPCRICGEDKWWRLAFHHVESEEKEFGIPQASSLKRLIKELQKCIVVCHNCHADIHHEQRVGGSIGTAADSKSAIF